MLALVLAGFGALARHRHAPTERRQGTRLTIDWSRAGIVIGALLTIIGAISPAPGLEEAVPVLGIAIWVALSAALIARRPDGSVPGRQVDLDLAAAALAHPPRLPVEFGVYVAVIGWRPVVLGP